MQPTTTLPQSKPKETYLNNSLNRKPDLEESDENDPQTSNVYQKALKTFLGKDSGMKTPPPLPSSNSKIVRAKKNVLEEAKEEQIRPKKTLLIQEEKKGNMIKQVPSLRRPNSAPLKDKDKLNPKKPEPIVGKVVNQPPVSELYSNAGRSLISQVEGAKPQGSVLKPKENLNPYSNSIYKGPVIKKKVLN